MVKKKLGQRGVILLLGTLLLFSLAGNALGASGLTEIAAYLNTNIKVTLHGKLFEPKEDDGSKLVPITYKGRTYLPLRAVAEAAGLEVTWDPNTNTAHLGQIAGEIAKDQISYIQLTPEFGPDPVLYKLSSRTPAYLNRAPGRAFVYGYAADPGYYANITIFANTNYEYDTFKASFWVDETKHDGEYPPYPPKIVFKDEFDVVVKEIEVEWGKLYEDVEVPIKDVQTLQVTVDGDLSIIGEPKLGK
jgi:hypothetical protein